MTSMPIPIPERLRRFARNSLLNVDPAQTDSIATGHNANAGDELLLTKTGIVLGLLTRDSGASLDELVAATGWLQHSTRAALTGLRKKGHAITRDKIDGVTRYRIMPSVPK